jgi:hypothetical protein
MQPTLSPKPTDDPCDDVVTVSDAVQIAPSDEELSSLLQQAARHRLATETPRAAELATDRASQPIDSTLRAVSASDERSSQHARSTVPVIDVVDRPAPANDDLGARHRRSWGRRLAHAFVILLLASGIGLTAAAWKTYGAGATKLAARLTAQLLTGSSQPEQQAVAVQPAPPVASAETANAASVQPQPVAQTAPAQDATAPVTPASPDQTQLLQSMTRDLAALQQQVEELKGGIEQLKASQQQMSRDLARVSEAKPNEIKPSEQNPRPKTTTTAPTAPSRSAAVQKRPTRPVPPPQGYAAAPALSQAQAPYAPPPYYAPPQQRYLPPQPPPQATTEPPVEWDASAPRPPMPLR